MRRRSIPSWLLSTVFLTWACGNEAIDPVSTGATTVAGASQTTGSSDGAGGAGGASTLPPPRGEIAIPARDGVALRTWVYLPSGDGPFPLFVVRNPYASLNDAADLEAYAHFFEAQGIGLVWQAVRGTGGSGGELIPYVSEVADAADTLAWLGEKPWSNGRFATGGGSYLGYTAWAAAAADTRVRVVLSDDTAADEEMTRHGGVVDGYLLSWWSFVARERFANESELAALTNALDVLAADEAVLGRDLPYWNALLGAGLDVYPPGASLRDLAARICTPALHIVEGGTGWRDPILTWDALQKDGCAAHRDHQWLVIAPESHAYHFSAFGYGDTWMTGDMGTMLRAFLLEEAPIPDWARVRYRASPEGPTASLDAWPPTGTTPVTFFLGAPGGGEGTLSTSAPAADAWTIVSDPDGTDPCVLPSDVWFTSPALSENLTIVGEPKVTLTATSDASDFDLFVTLYDYAAASRSYAVIGTGSVRARHRNGGDVLVPKGTAIDLVVPLTGVAHDVPIGHQLTMRIAPSACGFVENPHTGAPLEAQTTWQAATVDVALGPQGAALTIPTLP